MEHKGKVEFLSHESTVLQGNPLGDPHVRDLPVYTPPGYDPNSEERYPVIFGIPGFTGSGMMYLYRFPFKQPMDELLDELILQYKMPPVIYVMPDCLTRYGGSQYVNSSAVGNYEDYLVKELVPFVKENFKTTENFGIMGGSSGGIGSFTLAAKNPDVFCAFADHSGDSAFEYCYLMDVPNFVMAMEGFDYNLESFVESIQDRSLEKGNDFIQLLNVVAMAACYSPNPDSPLGFELPFDIRSGALIPEVWERWLRFDPVHMIPHYQENLKKLKLLYVDCGKKDQFNLLLGARQVHDQLEKHGIEHHYEEYVSDHFLLRREQKRKSIPLLVSALKGH